ncbi:MAG: hypothetical protein JWO67_6155 [Streptosporangiaceae bacterium]|nr:hypothetical protein [Streptosporangiaceae bacterium]
MPSSVSLGPCLFLDGPSFDASVFRVSDAAALAYNGASRGGVYQGPNRLDVAAASGLNLTVGPGTAIVPSAAGTTDGAYRVANNQTRTVSVGTPDSVNPRIDLVVAGVQDNGDGTSAGFVQVVAGTPAPSPSPPSPPSNTIALYRVLVGANVLSITSANLTDVRAFQVAPGGVLPVSAASAAPAGVDGQYGYEAANDRLFHIAGSGPRQARVLPWAPKVNHNSGNVVNTGSETTVLTLSITTDGSTDIEIWAKWRGIFVSSAGGNDMRAIMIIRIGSTQVSDLAVYNPFNDGTSRGGGVLLHRTSSVVGDTPSAGTHTIKWSFTEVYAGSLHVVVDGGPSSPLLLVARPVVL